MRPQPPSPSESLTVNGVDFTHADIHSVVERFYTQVAVDPLLSQPFSSVEDWPHHIERLTHFWWARLGGGAYQPYMYNPVGKHFEAGFNQEFLSRWLELFGQTLKSTLKDEQAQLWSTIAQRMGQALSMKNEMLKASLRSPPDTF